MTERQAIEAIAEAFVAGWQGIYGNPSTVPYALENDAMPTYPTFVMMTVGDILRTELTTGAPGTRRVECRSTIMVKCWTPANKGGGAAADLMDSAAKIFNGINIAVGSEAINVFAGTTRKVGTNGTWFMKVAVFPVLFHTTE